MVADSYNNVILIVPVLKVEIEFVHFMDDILSLLLDGAFVGQLLLFIAILG